MGRGQSKSKRKKENFEEKIEIEIRIVVLILKITNKKNYFSSDLVVYVNFAFPVHMKILNKQCNINNMLRLNV